MHMIFQNILYIHHFHIAPDLYNRGNVYLFSYYKVQIQMNVYM